MVKDIDPIFISEPIFFAIVLIVWKLSHTKKRIKNRYSIVKMYIYKFS